MQTQVVYLHKCIFSDIVCISYLKVAVSVYNFIGYCMCKEIGSYCSCLYL